MTGPDLHDLLGRRWFTPVFLVRRWQIEKNRGEHAGEFEEPGVTPERLLALRRLVAECFPAAQVSWSLSRGALLTASPHWDAVRATLSGFVARHGDAVVPNPCSGYTVLHNSSDAVEEELEELFLAVQSWLGAPPRAIQAWILLSRSIQRMHERFGLDAVTGQCFSQHGIDGMSMEGSVAYPCYPSRRHVLLPAQDAADQVDVPLLDAISLDLVTARGSRKRFGRGCRMGLQLLETVNWRRVGPEAGLRELCHVADTYLRHNHGRLPFSWITTTQELVEVFRHPFSFPCYESWWRWLAASYPDLNVVTTAELGRRFRRTFAANTWHYSLEARGSGVGPSDPATTIRWQFAPRYRTATLERRRWGRRRSRVIDFVDYTQEAREPDGPCTDVSLVASPWQKTSRW